MPHPRTLLTQVVHPVHVRFWTKPMAQFDAARHRIIRTGQELAVDLIVQLMLMNATAGDHVVRIVWELPANRGFPSLLLAQAQLDKDDRWTLHGAQQTDIGLFTTAMHYCSFRDPTAGADDDTKAEEEAVAQVSQEWWDENMTGPDLCEATIGRAIHYFGCQLKVDNPDKCMVTMVVDFHVPLGAEAARIVEQTSQFEGAALVGTVEYISQFTSIE